MVAQQQTDPWPMIDRVERLLNDVGVPTVYCPGFVPDLEAMIREYVAGNATADQKRIQELEDQLAEAEDRIDDLEDDE
jgi:hypothetical protein